MRLVLNDNNDLAFKGLTNSTSQRLKQRLRLFKGEYFMDVDAGFPYFDLVLGQREREADFSAYLKRYIRLTAFVKELVKYKQEINTETRRLDVKFTVIDENGESVTISESF